SVVGRDALSAVNHGDAAVATCESICGVWARTVAGHLAHRHERNPHAVHTSGDRPRLRARIGARVAFPTFRSYACHATPELVPRVLRAVHDLSFHFPLEVCGQNCAMGCRRASWTVAILPGVSGLSAALIRAISLVSYPWHLLCLLYSDFLSCLNAHHSPAQPEVHNSHSLEAQRCSSLH